MGISCGKGTMSEKNGKGGKDSSKYAGSKYLSEISGGYHKEGNGTVRITLDNDAHIIGTILSLLILFTALFLMNQYSFLLFHTVAEIFSIFVAIAIFIVTWNSRKLILNNFYVFLGISYLFIGIIDLLHTLAYKGMNIFTGYDANLPTQLGIAGRYMESLALLLALFFIQRKLNVNFTIGFFSIVSGLLLSSIFFWGIFPVCYVEGVGLTPFKIMSEYVISLILLASLFFLYKNREHFESYVFRLIFLSILLTIFSELAFTFYMGVYDLSNQIGHYFKIFSFYLIYLALVKTGIEKPLTSLFYNMEKRRKDLEEANITIQEMNRTLEAKVEERTAKLKESKEKFRQFFENEPELCYMVSPDGIIMDLNSTALEVLEYSKDDLLGKPLEMIYSPESQPRMKELFAKWKETGKLMNEEMIIVTKAGDRRNVLLSSGAVRDEKGQILSSVSVQKDITELKKAERALIESKENYRTLYEDNPLMIFTLDSQGTVITVNRKGAEELGYNKEELVGKTVLKVFLEEDREIVQDQIRKCLENPLGIASWELRKVRKDGTILWVRETSRVLTGGDGEMSLLIVCEDITELIKAEDILKTRLYLSDFANSHSEEELLQATLDNAERLTGSSIGFFHFLEDDQNTLQLFTWSTNTLKKMCTLEERGRRYPLSQAGVWVDCVYQKKPVIHNDYESLPNKRGLPPGHAPVLRELVVPVIHGDKISAIIGVGNKESDYDESDSNTISTLVHMIWDIILRKKGDEEIKKVNRDLTVINKVISTSTSTLDKKEIMERLMDEALNLVNLEGGTICLVEPDKTLSLAAHRGASQATIEDLGAKQVRIGDCLCGNCAMDFKPLILNNREEVMEYATRETLRGEKINFHAAFPMVSRGKCHGVLCVFTRTDKKPEISALNILESITSQVAMYIENAHLYEATLINAENLEKEVGKRTEELKIANIKLQEMDKLKSLFIASMSHELRTPLNSIIGFTGIMLQELPGKLNEEQKKQLNMVKNSSKHLLNLINDIIDLSKIEAGKIDIEPEEFDLSEIIKEVRDSFSITLKEKSLEMPLEIPESLIIKSDEKRVKQVLVNLVGNGVKFTDRGEVSVAGLRKDDGVQVSIRDTGIGIRPEDMGLLFRQFSQVTTLDRPKQEGTGLGLYLSKKIITTLGGEIWVESDGEGRGSIFTFTLPLEYRGKKDEKGASS